MIADLSARASYVDGLNLIQRQMLSELGVDFLWGESLAPDLQKIAKTLSESASQASVESTAQSSSSSVEVQQQADVVSPAPVAVAAPTVPTATKEAANAHADEARKMLQRARHRAPTPIPAEAVASQGAPAPVPASQGRQSVADQASPASSQSSSAELAAMSWQALRREAEAYDVESSPEQQASSVFEDKSEGRQCDWLFLEQPSRPDAERYGPAMTKQVQALFEQMLFALGLERSEISVFPLLKSPVVATSENPKAQWQAACSPILLEQIKRVQPKCIVAFGDAAASLLQVDKGLLALMKQSLSFQHPELGNIPVVATFSPYYLLSNSSAKAQAWQDLKRARQIITEHDA